MVVGIKNINNNEQASLVLSVKIRRIVPLIKRSMAANNIKLEIASGKPLLTIYCAWVEKFVIFPGIAFTKIALSSSLPKKFNE